MPSTVLHLRSETKPAEHRSALTPGTVGALLDAGYTVHIERSPDIRIFKDEEFPAGAEFVPQGSWPDAPRDHLILGLKELPEEDFPLAHTHITFAHCYKGQVGWEQVLSRFARGGGLLYDLEFLQDSSGRRIAAFGYHAGYAGAALALLTWAHQIQTPDAPFPGQKHRENEDVLISEVRQALESARRHASRSPRVLVIGALGRCGGGAIAMCKKAGIPDSDILQWDMNETAKGGPFSEIVESDIFINCIYLTSPTKPFITHESLDSPSRALSVICDVSCDPTSPYNPVPIYDRCSTFSDPLIPIKVKQGPPLTVLAIDHLPSLLPRESSEAFSEALLPSMKTLNRRHEEPVWTGAEKLFNEKVIDPAVSGARRAHG